MMKTNSSGEDKNQDIKINKLQSGVVGYGFCLFLTAAALSSFLPHIYLVTYRPEEEWCAGFFRFSEYVVGYPLTMGIMFSMILFITFILALFRYSVSPGLREAAPWLIARAVLVVLSVFLVFESFYVVGRVNEAINKRVVALLPPMVSQFQPGVTTRNDIETQVLKLNASLACPPREGFLGKRASQWEKRLYQDIQEGLQMARNGENVNFEELYNLGVLGFYVDPNSIDHTEKQEFRWNYGQPLAAIYIIYYLYIQYDESDRLKKARYVL